MTDNQQRRTAETFDRYEKTYAETVNRSVSFTGLKVDFFTKVKARYIVRLAEEYLGCTRKLRVLDIGCGIGSFHGFLVPCFGEVKGVDVSASSIKEASSRHPEVAYKIYDGTRLPYDDDSVDLAVTVCVMHHVPPESWLNFVSEIYRVVRPGGVALVFEHNPRNPLTMKAVNDCPFDEDAVLLRSRKTESLLRAAGFSSVVSRFILSVPPANAALMAVDRLFSRLPFGAQYYTVGLK